MHNEKICGVSMQNESLNVNSFLIGYHVNDLGEIDDLMDHNGVGVEVRRIALFLGINCN